MAFAELEGVRLHFELSDGLGLPVLVFSNSLGANLSMWEAQAAALSGRFRILRYDTRGHGQSSVPDGPYSAEELGGDLLGLLDALAVDRFSFCGLSMGGSTGQWLAIHAADRLEKLVLANTAAKIGSAEMWDARIATVEEQGLGPVAPGTLERWYTAEFRAEAPDVVTRTSEMILKTDPAGYAACCAAIRDADFRAELTGISAPTLVIAGTHDPVTTVADGRFLAEGIPGAAYVELDAAHLSCIEASGEFNNALMSFFVSR